ncbi:MAG: hypothetical protein SFT81_04510 [Candidatus Caenarcaniphilales bacterium]|nr:hypothetical protein [Candidatus Caenarcaniphilales bacterium]
MYHNFKSSPVFNGVLLLIGISVFISFQDISVSAFPKINFGSLGNTNPNNTQDPFQPEYDSRNNNQSNSDQPTSFRLFERSGELCLDQICIGDNLEKWIDKLSWREQIIYPRAETLDSIEKRRASFQDAFRGLSDENLGKLFQHSSDLESIYLDPSTKPILKKLNHTCAFFRVIGEYDTQEQSQVVGRTELIFEPYILANGNIGLKIASIKRIYQMPEGGNPEGIRRKIIYRLSSDFAHIDRSGQKVFIQGASIETNPEIVFKLMSLDEKERNSLKSKLLTQSYCRE